MAILVRLYWLIRHLLSESGAAARRRTPPQWRSWPLRGCFNDVGTHLAYRVGPQALQCYLARPPQWPLRRIYSLAHLARKY